MGVPLALAAKLSLISLTGSGQICITPVVASLMWPFVFKVLLNLRPIHQVFTDTIHSSRLFFFQMGQIAFASQPATPSPPDRRTRWRRAFRLMNERLHIARTRRVVEDSNEESLRAVSVLAL